MAGEPLATLSQPHAAEYDTKSQTGNNKGFLELKIDYGVLGEVTQMKKKVRV